MGTVNHKRGLKAFPPNLRKVLERQKREDKTDADAEACLALCALYSMEAVVCQVSS